MSKPYRFRSNTNKKRINLGVKTLRLKLHFVLYYTRTLNIMYVSFLQILNKIVKTNFMFAKQFRGGIHLFQKTTHLKTYWLPLWLYSQLFWPLRMWLFPLNIHHVNYKQLPLFHPLHFLP